MSSTIVAAAAAAAAEAPLKTLKDFISDTRKRIDAVEEPAGSTIRKVLLLETVKGKLDEKYADPKSKKALEGTWCAVWDGENFRVISQKDLEATFKKMKIKLPQELKTGALKTFRCIFTEEAEAYEKMKDSIEKASILREGHDATHLNLQELLETQEYEVELDPAVEEVVRAMMYNKTVNFNKKSPEKRIADEIKELPKEKQFARLAEVKDELGLNTDRYIKVLEFFMGPEKAADQAAAPCRRDLDALVAAAKKHARNVKETCAKSTTQHYTTLARQAAAFLKTLGSLAKVVSPQPPDDVYEKAETFIDKHCQFGVSDESLTQALVSTVTRALAEEDPDIKPYLKHLQPQSRERRSNLMLALAASNVPPCFEDDIFTPLERLNDVATAIEAFLRAVVPDSIIDQAALAALKPRPRKRKAAESSDQEDPKKAKAQPKGKHPAEPQQDAL